MTNPDLPEAANTANEYENPGANYPDREDVNGIEPEGEELRRDEAAEGAVSPPSEGPDRVSGSEDTQDEPVLDQHETTTDAKVDGILAQTRADLGAAPVERYEEVLSQRFSDAGIEVSADHVQAFAERLAAGAGE